MTEGRSEGVGGGQKRFASFLLSFPPYLVSNNSFLFGSFRYWLLMRMFSFTSQISK